MIWSRHVASLVNATAQLLIIRKQKYSYGYKYCLSTFTHTQTYIHTHTCGSITPVSLLLEGRVAVEE